MSDSYYKSSCLMIILYILLILNSAYTFLWTTFGLSVTNIIQYALLTILVFYASKSLFKIFSKKIFGLSLILILDLTLAFFFTGSIETTQYKSILLVLLVAIPFALEPHSPKLLKLFLISICSVSIFSFFYDLSYMRSMDDNAYGGGYLVLVTLPVGLFLLRSKGYKFHFLWSIIVLFLVLASVKRGDILACILSIAVYFTASSKGKSGINIKQVFSLLLVCVIAYYAIKYMASASDLFSSRLQSTINGDSSERDFIYKGLLNYFTTRATIFEQLFGGGFDKTLEIIDARAHSDWLELLIDVGCLGCFLYAKLIHSLYKLSTRFVDVHLKSILYVVLVIWMIKSIFSMYIYSEASMIMFVLVGCMINNNNTLKIIDRKI